MQYTGMEEETLGKNKVRFIGTSILTIALACIAITPGIGHQTTVEIHPLGALRTRSPTQEGGVIYIAQMFEGSIHASFNPLLYPISYLAGSCLISEKFIRFAEFYDPSGQGVADMVTRGTIFIELLKNIPYLLGAGFIATLGIEKAKNWLKVRKDEHPTNKS